MRYTVRNSIYINANRVNRLFTGETMSDRTIPERLAALEATVPTLHADVTEIKGDVKTLLAAHNRQQGFITMGRLAWGGFCGGMALLGEWVINHLPPWPHS